MIKWNHYINSLTVSELKEAGIHLDKVIVTCGFVGIDPCDFPLKNEAVIAFSSPASVPDINNDVYSFDVGKEHTFSVSESISHMLPPPYVTNCTDYDEMGKAPFRGGLLTQQTCFTECVANLTFEMCGCMYDDYPYLYELPGPVRRCQQSVEEGACKTNPFKSETVDARHYCEGLCRIPCRKISFEVAYVEVLPLPSGPGEKGMAMQLYQSFLNRPISLESLRTTGVKVTLILNNKEVIVYRHYPKYQNVELFGYIGGYLGIWLGISLTNILDLITESSSKVKNLFLYLKGQSSKI
ncbi:amiloride-sensitive sodium channel subunit alpha-like isoform X2 [Limulus polyphemus]|uniref:Amiloride-sensitive sodium channel subunit alpha-like isoform X2 n=1 Tax=Limulus polyphemus TaxID=6850 RepID=A0ABM1T710_LIMPO|nr:amiloride-sensitive sodium channel subunit alpha-like isoform X2 [Limulus polyphemus]